MCCTCELFYVGKFEKKVSRPKEKRFEINIKVIKIYQSHDSLKAKLSFKSNFVAALGTERGNLCNCPANKWRGVWHIKS